MQLTIDDILQAIGGDEVLLADHSLTIESLEWDSRKVQPGGVYVALPGERVDGHDFIDAAVDAGAKLIIATKVPESVDVFDYVFYGKAGYVVVDDGAMAIARIAEAWRNRLSAHVVGITGSVGKTTTRGLVAAVLSAGFKTHSTKGNFNNELGLPYTLLQTEADCEALVVEMGMDGLGQIAHLCSAAHPDFGLITNVGTSHMEHLGSRENIARAKAEIVEALPDGRGVAFLQADGDFTDFICDYARVAERGVRVVRFGGTPEQGSDVYATDVTFDAAGHPSFILHASGRAVPCSLALRGMHNVGNACGAAAVGLEMGLSLETVAQALAGAQPEAGREQLLHAKGGFEVFNDAYNASPESMRASLSMLASYETRGRRIAVLGDMGELGPAERSGHEQTGIAAARAGIDLLICVGELSKLTAQAAAHAGMDSERIVQVANADEAVDALRARVQPGDVVLVKASHFMGLEQVAERMVD